MMWLSKKVLLFLETHTGRCQPELHVVCTFSVLLVVSLIHFDRNKSFTVGLGLHQDCRLSKILFIIFIGRISICSQSVEGVGFVDLSILFLLCADDVVLWASSVFMIRQ